MLPDAVRSIWEGKRDTSALCKHVDPVSAGIIRFIVLLVNDMEEKCPADTSEMLPDLFDALDHIKRFEPREMRRLFKGKSERAIPCAGWPRFFLGIDGRGDFVKPPKLIAPPDPIFRNRQVP